MRWYGLPWWQRIPWYFVQLVLSQKFEQPHPFSWYKWTEGLTARPDIWKFWHETHEIEGKSFDAEVLQPFRIYFPQSSIHNGRTVVARGNIPLIRFVHFALLHFFSLAACAKGDGASDIFRCGSCSCKCAAATCRCSGVQGHKVLLKSFLVVKSSPTIIHSSLGLHLCSCEKVRAKRIGSAFLRDGKDDFA